MDEFYSNENCFLTTKCVLFTHLLGSVKEVICPLFIHQFFVGAKLLHLSVFEEKNMVNETDSTESVGNNDACMLFNIRK